MLAGATPVSECIKKCINTFKLHSVQKQEQQKKKPTTSGHKLKYNTSFPDVQEDSFCFQILIA